MQGGLGIHYSSDSDEDDEREEGSVTVATPTSSSTAPATQSLGKSVTSASTTLTKSSRSQALKPPSTNASRSNTPLSTTGSTGTTPRATTTITSTSSSTGTGTTTTAVLYKSGSERIRELGIRPHGASKLAGSPARSPSISAIPPRSGLLGKICDHDSGGDGGIGEEGVNLTEEEFRELLKPRVIPGLTIKSIPPEPEGECDPELQAKISQWHELRKKGKKFNDQLMRTQSFKNPAIMSKLIEFIGLDEHGSNLPKSYFDPKGFDERLYYDELAKQQRLAAERPPTRFQVSETGDVTVTGGVKFQSGATLLPPGVPSTLSSTSTTTTSSLILSNVVPVGGTVGGSSGAGVAIGTKRKSKWDQPVGDNKK
ncbi:hypothetical protein HDU76_009606 [Blyttiomyces sp. JEL0837]|nr:hypothetical protein HDU76_009606 [Blyttiomyces sp. JEL0837]